MCGLAYGARWGAKNPTATTSLSRKRRNLSNPKSDGREHVIPDGLVYSGPDGEDAVSFKEVLASYDEYSHLSEGRKLHGLGVELNISNALRCFSMWQRNCTQETFATISRHGGGEQCSLSSLGSRMTINDALNGRSPTSVWGHNPVKKNLSDWSTSRSQARLTCNTL